MPAKTRRRPKGNLRANPRASHSLAERSNGYVSPDFFEIMDRVAHMLEPPNQTWDEMTKEVHHQVDALIKKASKAGPLPDRLATDLKCLQRSVEALRDPAIREGLPHNVFAGLQMVHPVLECLMRDDFEHLEKTFGRDVAEREFRKVVDVLIPHRHRGRPATIPLETVQLAKTLRDKGWPYSKIGIKVGLTGTQVRSALTHRFPKR